MGISKNTVLVVGSGGREHALAWRLAQSPTVDRVYVAPGNGGTACEAGMENVALSASDQAGLISFCQGKGVDLVVIGPEQPLVAGLTDAMTAAGIACFGPSAKAARLEGSKAFSKDFLQKYHIPTADYAVFTEPDAAKAYVRARNVPIVIKADGLAAGKGVIIAENLAQADAAIDDMLQGNAFGEAGHRIVIEEFLSGEEASFIVMADGRHFLPLATSQDHKARDDGDRGPNTGGMGAYSPAPVVDEAVYNKTIERIIKPTLAGMAAEGAPFTGFLYAGLMIDAQGNPKVLEFNVRCGDPETQPIMRRLLSPLDQLCLAAIRGELDTVTAQWDKRPALGVVMAEKGYPESYAKGNPIEGIEAAERLPEVKVFHAGTACENSKLVTAGGRVLCVTALADDLATAQQRAYAAVGQIHWGSAFYRRDIGNKAL
jgi:phosphoribosylamine--glycine ligase